MQAPGAASAGDVSFPLKNLRRDTRQASKWTPLEPESPLSREGRDAGIHLLAPQVELVVVPLTLALRLPTCFRRKCLLGET